MAGWGTAESGLVFLGNQVAGSTASYTSKTYGDAENAGTLTYPHFVVMLAIDKQPLLKSLGMMASGGEYPPFCIYHYCHFLPVAGSPDYAFNFPSEGDMVDAYQAACIANPFFTGAVNPSIHSGYDVTVRLTKTQILNIQHHTIIFEHRVEIFK